MSETKSPLGGLTRRGFLKTTGAVTAVAAVAGTGAALAPMPANAEGSSSADGEQTFRSACRGNCGSRCPLEVTVREGKVVKARPMGYARRGCRPQALLREGVQPAAARVRYRPAQVPHEARRGARSGRVGAHQLGRGC